MFPLCLVVPEALEHAYMSVVSLQLKLTVLNLPAG